MFQPGSDQLPSLQLARRWVVRCAAMVSTPGLRRATRSHPLAATIVAGLVALVVAFGLWFAIQTPNDSDRDLPIYEEDATIVLQGHLPYRDVPIEYPPGALPMFLLPEFMFGDARDAHWSPPNDHGHRYRRAFDSLIVLLAAAMVTLTALSAAALRRSTAATAVALAVVASAPLLIGHVFVERFDAWPTALTAAAIAAALRGHYRLGGAALGLGFAAKVYPALLVPVLVVVAARHRGLREAVATATSTVAAAVLVFLPFAITAWTGTRAMLRHQLGGGLQVETLMSSVTVMTRHLTDWLGLKTTALTVHPEAHGLGRDVLDGPGIEATKTTLNVLLVIALVALWIALARSENDPREDLVRYSALTIAVALVLGTVLSAQYITWPLPLVPLVAWRRGLVATIAYVVAAALTNAWIPSPNYGNYVTNFDLGATSLLLARNLALLATALALALPSWRTVREFIGHSGEPDSDPQRPPRRQPPPTSSEAR
jgi:Glycosyltransferase family 87